MTGPTAVSRSAHGAPGAPSVPVAKVLVVDDEYAIREQLAETFRLAGFDVTAVASGVAALNTAYAEPPDLVVLDIRLPDFDSLEVARILRDEGHDIPVVFLPKPFVLENIVTRVREILSS